MNPFVKFEKVPKGDPRALFSIEDRPSLHKTVSEQPQNQLLSLPWRPRRGSHRRDLRAIDMAVTPSQRETVYQTVSRSARDTKIYKDGDGQLIRAETRSPATKSPTKRLSHSLANRSTSPKSPRRSPIIVQERSPRISPVYAEDTFTRLPDFHPAQLPKPDPYPVFIHSRSTKQDRYESDSDDWTTDSEYAYSDSARYDKQRVRRRHRRHNQAIPPPPAPESPDIVINQINNQPSLTGGYYEEYDRYERIEDTEYPREGRPRRTRSHRDSGHHHHHHHHSSRRSGSHHGHGRHRSASRVTHVRSESGRERDLLQPLAPEVPLSRSRSRARTVGASPAGAVRRERSVTRRTEVKGLLDDPRDVRTRELIEERQVFPDGRTKVRQYQYR